ncbi:MAG: TonB-linked outer membrane protein SusC/RagA family [Mucilaginibacter sp.]|nr:TonB-linked outer membrane protein SusC/RagA family [Mucilaginibacter sp.]
MKHVYANKINYIKILVAVLLCLAWGTSRSATTLSAYSSCSGELSGVVQDMKNNPLAGVTVGVKGKSQTVLTGPDGHFALPGVFKDTLVFAKAGYLSKEVLVLGNSFFLVVLRPEVEELREVSVVSTGYQTLALEKATGAFEKVDGALLNRSVGTDVLSRLDGVSSVQFDRRVGKDNALMIRGRSTLFANASPLVVVDNFPYNGDLENLNPNDIESITILKDAAAASIWGVRAANGVIVVTTKKGSKNRPLSVSFNANVTIADKPDMFNLPRMSSADFIDVEQLLFSKGFYNDLENSYAHVGLSPAVELLIAQRDGKLTADQANTQINALKQYDVRNDLEKYWYRKAVNQQYALSLNGGSDKTTYFFSAGYDHNLSALSGTFQRLNLRSDNSFYLLKNLQLDVGTYLTNSRTVAGRDDYTSLVSSDGRQLYPYARLADGQGNALPVNLDYRGAFVESSMAKGFLDWHEYPLDDYKNMDNRTNQLDLLLNTAIKYKVLPGLNAELRYQLESAQTQGTLLYSQDSYYSRNMVNQYTQVNTDGSLTRPIPAGGILKTSDTKLLSNSFRAQLNYTYDFGKNQLTALAGYEYRNDNTRYRAGGDYGYNADIQSGLPVDYVTSFPLSNYSYFFNSPIPYPNSYQTIQNYNLSYFSNVAYAYDNRYSFSASARKDESNLFGVNANQKGVPLYSVGTAWTINNEAFYHAKWLPYLKLRLSYGYSGNVDNTLAAQATIRYLGQSPLGKQTYAIINNPPNPDLGWEKTRIWNIGMDFQLIGNLLSGSVDYYRKKGTDLIGYQPLDQTTGVLNPATGLFQYKGNVAEMQGQGLEVNLHASNLRGALKWQTDLLFNYAANKVTQYYRYNDLASNFVSDGLGISPLVGKPLYAILTYPWAGLDPETGDPRGYVNGQVSKDYAAILKTTKITELRYSGPAVPPYFGNLRNTISYKGISLSASLSYKFGYFFMRRGISYNSLFNNNDTQNSDYGLRWQKPGDEKRTNVPSMVYPADSQRDQFYNQSSVNVEKGDHIRLQDLRLSFDADRTQFKRMPLKHVQVYLYAANLGLIWKATKTSLDPDYPYSPRPPKILALGFSGNF